MKTAKELVDDLAATGLTQAQIAEEAGLTQATVSRIQAGVSGARSVNWGRLKALHEKRFPPVRQAAA